MADNMGKISDHQRAKLKAVGIDQNSYLNNKVPIDHVRKILAANVPDEEKQLALNISRNAMYKLNHTFKHSSYNPQYRNNDPGIAEINPRKQAEIEAMYKEMPYLSEYAAEVLWAVNMRTVKDLRAFIAAASSANFPDYLNDARQRGLAVRAAAEDLFELILKNRDVYPDQWYDTYYCVEMVLNSALNPDIAPPTNKYP